MDAKMNKRDVWGLDLPKGLDLQVSQHPITMRSVVNLIIAMERLKGGEPESVLSTDFRDENLLSIMLDSIVEERLVLESALAPSAPFSRTGQQQCSVTDSRKRSLVLVESSMELYAMTLQGGSSRRGVHLNMSSYVRPVISTSTKARPVALGIKDTNLYLSCHEDSNNKPCLHLEAVEDTSVLQTIDEASELLRFLFYKQDSGTNLSTLESARYPDWFVSTAKADGQPLIVSEEESGCYQTFNMQLQS